MPIVSRKTNHDYVNNSHSNSATYMPVPSLDLHYQQKRDIKAEYLAQLKEVLSQIVQYIDFVDLFDIRRAYEALIQKVNRHNMYWHQIQYEG